MPKYYHIHRGTKRSTVEKKFIKNYPFFFSKKQSGWGWYNCEKKISEDYGGYIEYEIDIPASRFTTSFNPRTKNKIVKITKENIKEYETLRIKQCKGNRSLFIEEMIKRNIIGIDATTKLMMKYFHVSGGWPEGFIWKKPNDIKIKSVKCVKLSKK